MVRKVR